MNELQNLSKYFTSLIDTIPSSIYFNHNEDVVNEIKAKRTQSFQDDKENGLSAKAKIKRIKLDVSTNLKVSDMAFEHFNKKKNDKKRKALKKKLQKKIKELQQARGLDSMTVDASNGHDQGAQFTINKKAKIKKLTEKDASTPKILNSDGIIVVYLIFLYLMLFILGNLVFSKFDLTSHDDSLNSLPAKTEKKKNLKALFKMSVKNTNKLKKLEKTDIEAADRMKKKEIWENALHKAEGNKVLNDPKLLEKKIKRKMKEKVKSAKTWKERKDKVEHRKNKRQDKRDFNINKRKEAKKEKKMKLLKKKGRIL